MTGGTLLESFDSRRNSLNALRLVLAGLVLVSHSWALTGRTEPAIGSLTVGTFAVCGFFALSGFLVTRSRTSTSAARYAWHRMLRIMPGFWTALVVVAFVIAPLTYWYDHGTLGGYALTDAGHYVTSNASLIMQQYGIPGTLTSTPRSAWDGSLWSLLYEAIGYAVVLALGSIGFLARRRMAAAAAVTLVVVDVLFADWLRAQYALASNINGLELADLLVVFAAGGLLHLYCDHVPMRAWLAFASATVVTVGLLAVAHPLPFVALPLAYLLLWIGVRVPVSAFRRNDVSYGVYIYAFPVQQGVADVVGTRSVLGFIVLSAVVTAGFAIPSWRLVERRANALRGMSPPRAVRLGALSARGVTRVDLRNRQRRAVHDDLDDGADPSLVATEALMPAQGNVVRSPT